jgi:hypothetical protein
MAGGDGCGVRGRPLVDALTEARVGSETAGASSSPHPTSIREVEAAILAARAELAQAVQKGHLTRDPRPATRDPLRFALGGISEALGAFLAGIKTTRQPLDPAAEAEMVRQVIAAAAAGAHREAGRLVRTHNRRTLPLAALTLAVVAAAGMGGGYFWGRASAAADIQATTVELATAFRDGPAAARSWLELMRNNNVQAGGPPALHRTGDLDRPGTARLRAPPLAGHGHGWATPQAVIRDSGACGSMVPCTTRRPGYMASASSVSPRRMPVPSPRLASCAVP